MRIMAVGAYHALGCHGGMETLRRASFGMTGAAQLRLRLDEQTRIFRRMGQVTFQAGANSGGTMQKITLRIPFVAMGAQSILLYHKT